jgi:hypothetical protein
MHEEDLELLVGGLEEWRATPGWQDPEAQGMLDRWEEDARCRVEQAEDLPRELWYRVYEAPDTEEDDERSKSNDVYAEDGPSARAPRGGQEGPP